MKAIDRRGGLLGAIGGLIWAVLFLMEATNPRFDLRDQLLGGSTVGLALVFGVALQAVGFYSLSIASADFSVPRFSAVACAAGALVQSLALMAASTTGFGAAWIFGILGELVITLALGVFAVSTLSTRLPRLFSVIPFLMIPFYFVGWAVDPQSGSGASIDVVNLSAAIYGLLWVPFGYAVWGHLRDRAGIDRPDFGAA